VDKLFGFQLAGASTVMSDMPVSDPATDPRAPTPEPVLSSAASAAGELLRLSVSAGRFTGVAGLAFAVAFVLVLLYEGLWVAGGLTGLLLMGALLARIQLCRRLLALGPRQRRLRAHWFTAAAGVEGALWGAALLLAAPADPVAGLIQFEITVAITMVGALTYGMAGWAGLAFGLAVAFGQLAFLALRPLPLHELIVLAWVLTLAAVTGVACWLRAREISRSPPS
jgi:hypothetical protein